MTAAARSPFQILLKTCLIIFGVLAFALIATWQILVNSPISSVNHAVIYVYDPGTAPSTLVRELQALGGMRKPKTFLRYLKYHKLTRRLQAGVYEVSPGETIVTLANKLVTGRVVQYDFTIIEGWTLNELLEKLAQTKGLTADTNEHVFATFTDAAGVNTKHAEGLFMPETYRYPHGYSKKTLLLNAHKALLAYVRKAWASRASDVPYRSWYDALIVASLIEKETMLDRERALIAGVILNRLRKDMILQIDAAVIYGLGESFDGDLTRTHLRTPTPYNTYTEKGLPPTPIALTSRKSIDAAMHPAKTDYLYFVATGDGGHHFSATLDEHNRAVKKYILNQSRHDPGNLHLPGVALLQAGPEFH